MTINDLIEGVYYSIQGFINIGVVDDSGKQTTIYECIGEELAYAPESIREREIEYMFAGAHDELATLFIEVSAGQE